MFLYVVVFFWIYFLVLSDSKNETEFSFLYSIFKSCLILNGWHLDLGKQLWNISVTKHNPIAYLFGHFIVFLSYFLFLEFSKNKLCSMFLPVLPLFHLSLFFKNISFLLYFYHIFPLDTRRIKLFGSFYRILNVLVFFKFLENIPF